LGGGFGWLARRFGLTCDHLTEAEAVTGEGEFLTANESEHSDLLWALRGGGGGGVIVTQFRFRLRHFDPLVAAGLVVRRSEETADAVQRFRASCAAAPDEMTCMLKLCAAPAAPFLPKELHGKPVAITIVCHSGDRMTVSRDIDQLRTGPAVVADLIQQRPFADFQAMFDAGEPKGRRDYWKSEYVSSVDDEMIASLLAAIQCLPSPHANVKIFQLGGAVARLDPDRTAAANRDASFIIVIASAWNDARDDARNVDWVSKTWASVHRRSSRGGYINFLTQDADAEEQAQAQAGVNLERLQQIRRRYDPSGILGGLT
jgi:FAD/FMN-containing dehydrogenase